MSVQQDTFQTGITNKTLDTLLQLMQPEFREGSLYKCFSAEFNSHDLTPNELWEMFDVRWAALSEARLGKGMETFLMRDEIDGQSSTIQIAALDPAGHAVGGVRVHIAALELLGGIQAVQISRVGVSWVARGAGIGGQLIGQALRIAKALGALKSLPLVFLLGRVLDTDDPNRVLKLYERIGFRRTNLYTVTKGLSNCLMLAGVQEPALHYLRHQGFQVEEAREQGAIYPTLLIASSVARQIQSAGQPDSPKVEASAPLPVIAGRDLMLRHFVYADLPKLHYWQHRYDKPGYATRSRSLAPSMAELEADFAREVKTPSEQRFAIETVEGLLIGQLLYRDLRDDIRSAFIDVMIGEQAFWKGTWGKSAIGLLLEHLFESLGVHRVSILVSALQERVLHDLIALGFCQDGVLRHNEMIDGQYIDHYLMSILEKEYRS